MSRSRIIIELLRNNRLPTHRRPPTPGEIIREEFLAHMDLTQAELAAAMQIPVQRLNMILNGKRAVTPDTALRLSKCLGCSPQFWLGFQHDIDLYDAIVAMDPGELKRMPDLARVPPERAKRAPRAKAKAG
jgi:addiction module HigA family antidote